MYIPWLLGCQRSWVSFVSAASLSPKKRKNTPGKNWHTSRKNWAYTEMLPPIQYNVWPLFFLWKVPFCPLGGVKPTRHLLEPKIFFGLYWADWASYSNSMAHPSCILVGSKLKLWNPKPFWNPKSNEKVINAVMNIWYNRVVMAHDENLGETQTESESKWKLPGNLMPWM